MMRAKFKKLVGYTAAVLLVAGLAACGSDERQIPTGQVVKGVVTGAKVTDEKGTVLIASTLADGKFPLNGVGAVSTTGGTYTDMAGKKRNCPDLSAEAGDKNITPMTTLYKNATAADKEKLETLCKNAGVTPDTIVSGKTIPANLEAISKLNETIGEALTQLKDSGASKTEISSFETSLATQIVTTFTKLDDAKTTATLITAITSVTPPKPLNTTALTSIANSTIAGATIPDPPKTDTPVTTITGTTGGSSSGTSVK